MVNGFRLEALVLIALLPMACFKVFQLHELASQTILLTSAKWSSVQIKIGLKTMARECSQWWRQGSAMGNLPLLSGCGYAEVPHVYFAGDSIGNQSRAVFLKLGDCYRDRAHHFVDS